MLSGIYAQGHLCWESYTNPSSWVSYTNPFFMLNVKNVVKCLKTFHIDFLETLRFTPWALLTCLVPSNGPTMLIGLFNLSVSPREQKIHFSMWLLGVCQSHTLECCWEIQTLMLSLIDESSFLRKFLMWKMDYDF